MSELFFGLLERFGKFRVDAFVSDLLETRMTLIFSWLLSLLLTASIWQIWYVSTKSNPDLNDNLVFGALLGVIIQVNFTRYTTVIKYNF